MATEEQEMPFLKQLVDSDKKLRDKALESLKRYLSSGREFSELELLKLWKGLFYCIYHTPPPTQPTLFTSLQTLYLSLPPAVFVPYTAAFWTTLADLFPRLDRHRVDKYLSLMRRSVGSGVAYLHRGGWDAELTRAWLAEMAASRRERGGAGSGANAVEVGGEGREAGAQGEMGPLGLEGAGDGIRYHVIDVWVDEIVRVEEHEGGEKDEDGHTVPKEVVEELLGPLRELRDKGKTKIVREKAKEALVDERIAQIWGIGESIGPEGSGAANGNNEEWSGFG